MSAAPQKNMMISKGKEYVPDPNKFDLITHHWSPTGQLIRKNLYTLYVVEGNKFFERPVKSGNLWYENNTPAGRVEFDKAGIRKITEGKEHVAFTPKLEGDDALFYSLEQERARNAELEAELAAIKKDARKDNPYMDAKVEAAPLAKVMAESAAPSLGKKG